MSSMVILGIMGSYCTELSAYDHLTGAAIFLISWLRATTALRTIAQPLLLLIQRQ